jgi:hypothetical protein
VSANGLFLTQPSLWHRLHNEFLLTPKWSAITFHLTKLSFNKVVTHEYYELHVNEGCGPPVQNAHIIILLIAVATGDIIASIALTAFFSCSESDRSLNMGLPLHSLKKKKKN